MSSNILRKVILFSSAVGAAYYAYLKAMFVISVSSILYFDIDVGINDIPGAVETGLFDIVFHIVFVALSGFVVWSGFYRKKSFKKWVVRLLCVNCVYFLVLPIFMLAVGVPYEYAIGSVMETWVTPIGLPLIMLAIATALFNSKLWNESRI